MSNSGRSDGLPGGVKIFEAFGIDVYLHWTWFLAAYYFYQQTVEENAYHNPLWALAEVGALFAIVLIHEFGHALACRSVGGTALHIMLWPLGGAAFVDPPMRPGASLWTTAAGPLVNVVFVPIFFVLAFYVDVSSFSPDLATFFDYLFFMNLVLLIFNMLPIYPLDGGRILRELLWFVTSASTSLTIAAYVGLVGVAGLLGIAIFLQDFFLGAIAFFAGVQCKNGLEEAKRLKYQEPVRRSIVPDMISCPDCRQAPPIGPHWMCECGRPFDMLGDNGRCPHCERVYAFVVCPYCQHQASLLDWRTRPGGI
ncbi:MAG: site-2 protease family protein [Phycisphaerales bacterium]|nr:site-2 protease family protein [Phycisphaerales bacterium]MCB9857231.1 site-2 protease family protein [Phycisphaerales bacterium]MCB9863055.1 site-2 protease family protein [Phycisphaerales bacterium]